MAFDWSRVGAILAGFLLSIPAVFLRLIIRFIQLGCGIFYVKTRTVPPPCVTDPELGQHKFITVNGGQRIHYVEAGDPDKPLLVFQHGFPQFWFVWRNQIRYFKKDYHVVALDMRGYNDSGKPAGIDSYFIQNMADDLKGLVQGLGKEKFTLVAHDWGGAVAWLFAALYPDMLNRLIVLNLPHLTALDDSRKKTWDQALKSWYMIWFQCPLLPEMGFLAEDMAALNKMFKAAGADEEVLEAYKFAYRDFTTWNTSINYYRSLFSGKSQKYREEKRPLLENIKVKTLQIFGTADTALSLNALKEGEKYIVNGRTELLDGISHWVQEEAPERVNKLIDDFLNETDL